MQTGRLCIPPYSKRATGQTSKAESNTETDAKPNVTLLVRSCSNWLSERSSGFKGHRLCCLMPPEKNKEESNGSN